MQRRAFPSLPGIVVLGVAACTAPGLGNLTHDPPAQESATGASGSASEDGPATTSEPAPPTGTTSEDPATTAVGSTTTEGSSSSSSGSSTTTEDDPSAPPAIVDGGLGPDPLQQPGPVSVTIDTAHADGVRMQVDGGPVIELGPAEADAFTGEIVVYTALDNGPHFATFVAWRGELESEALELPFTVALPPMGSELFWEGDNAIGQGTVIALAVTPSHHLIELGTYYPQGDARCYLRRRSLGGTWADGDLFEVKPGLKCSAIDLAVDDDGALLVLVDKLEGGELRWWLGKYDAWAGQPVNVGAGVVGDRARALARTGDRAAVCGTRPKGNTVTATAWMFASGGGAGTIVTYDYLPPTQPPLPLEFSETPNDCTFLDDRLFITGEVKGKHEQDNVIRVKHFLLESGFAGEDPIWKLAASGFSQGGGRVITTDGDSQVMTGGYFCGDQCDPLSELRMFAGGQQVWRRSLDPLLLDPRALAWHPAGYVVFVASRQLEKDVTSFFAQAWFPLKNQSLWTYEHQDGPTIHTPTALAIGPYGQIYAGGITAGGYPAVAIIAP
ncbi:hypothetical protein [Nannocystis bainbridge]|uniref:Uncharacterized protein n=1 Tax=Nannocystis bainbridge TaxID=2995303 RepID=A0ABT5DSC1_9BACT|nr:hypothetical protein [Nannocystis bainbridge]MDC0715959.1 hypothetical protein [Nannocystis bainbridge]